MTERVTLYICDGKVPICSGRGACYRNPNNLNEVCYHTIDVKHAINGEMKAGNQERIFSATYTGSKIVYYEIGEIPKEIDI